MLLPVEDAEHQLQVLSDALQLVGYASAAQRAAGVSRLVLHARFLRATIRGKRPLAVALKAR
jgi:hypothetical protein